MIKAKTAGPISKKPIPAHAQTHFTASGCESTLGNWTVLALIKGAKYTLFFLADTAPFLGLKLFFLIYRVTVYHFSKTISLWYSSKILYIIYGSLGLNYK